MNDEITVTVDILHRAEKKTVRVEPGKTVADVLSAIDYPPQGHNSWRVWIGGTETSLATEVAPNTELILTHVSMGNLTTAEPHNNLRYSHL